MSFSELEKLLKGGSESLVVAVQGSRVTERGCKPSSFDLEQAVQIVRENSSSFRLRGLVDPTGYDTVDFTVPSLKDAVQSAVDELRDDFADLPRELHKYGVYYRGEKCSGPEVFIKKSALETKTDVGSLLGKPKPQPKAEEQSFFNKTPSIGTQMRELYALHSADADNKLVVTLRANLPTTGPPTCNFDESLSTVQTVAGNKSGDSAAELAAELLSAAKKVSQNAGGADAADIVVVFKPVGRCAFVALQSAELDYVEPLERILTSDESLEKNKIRLKPVADPTKLKNVPGDNATEKQAENKRRREEKFTPSGPGNGTGSGNGTGNGTGSGADNGSGGNGQSQPNNPPKEEKTEEEEDGGLSTLAIFGIVGSILLVIVLVLVFLIFRGRDSSASEQMPMMSLPPGGPPVPFRGPLLQNDGPFGPGLPPPPTPRPLPRTPTAGQFF